MKTPLDFEHILRLSPNPYMLLDAQLRYVWANDAYLRVTSSRLDDLIGRHILDAFPNDPSDPMNEAATRLRESFERVLASRAPDAIAFIPYHVPRPKDGGYVLEERMWSATHTPILDAEGEVAFILQHTEDVTELARLKGTLRADAVPDAAAPPHQVEAGVLRRAQQVQETNVSLDAERRHLRSLFEQAPGFICVLRGPDHVVELANDAYFRLVGQRAVVGRPIREALPEVRGQGHFELLDSVFSSGKPYVGRGVRVLMRRDPAADLEELTLDFVYQPIVDARGGVTGVFVQGHDITEQKRLEIELERLLDSERAARADAEAARADAERVNRLKDEFLATLSHELRTPLNALLGWARLLRTRTVTDDMRSRASEVIERNATLQAQIVEDILDVSRIITGKLNLSITRVDVNEVIDSAVDVVRPAAEAKGVRIERDSDPDVQIDGDPDRLRQVVWNLLANAIKFTPGGGSIQITLRQEQDAIDLAVRDTGAGIAAEFLPYVFERFRQADSGLDRRHSGLGLGLAICKHLVEAHGGEIEASSGGPGRGATFRVRLPISSVSTSEADADVRSQALRADTGREEAAELRGIRVLVVDDNADTLELLVRILSVAGATVEGAVSAVDALARLAVGEPDVLVSDIGLPGMDGLQLIRAIRENGSRVPAAAVTAFARPDDRVRAIREGYQIYLSKPIVPSDLVAAVAALAVRSRA